MRLTIAYSKIKKAKSSVNKNAYQREALTKWPFRLPLSLSIYIPYKMFLVHASEIWKKNRNVQTTRNFELFDKNRVFNTIFGKALIDAIFEDVSEAGTIV